MGGTAFFLASLNYRFDFPKKEPSLRKEWVVGLTKVNNVPAFFASSPSALQQQEMAHTTTEVQGQGEAGRHAARPTRTRGDP